LAPFEVSTEHARVDVDFVHRYLSEESYWAKGVPRETVARSIAHSIPFTIFDGALPIGFARVVTDRATFAYLADVFVVASHRGRGASKTLMEAILEHPDLQHLRRWHLVTRDAHGLYAQYGFTELDVPDRHMMRVLRDPYSVAARGKSTEGEPSARSEDPAGRRPA
jgi:GNAT superfamily N-acetyltransferase